MSKLILFHWHEKIVNVECDGYQISPDMLSTVLLKLHSKSNKSKSHWELWHSSFPHGMKLIIEFSETIDPKWLSSWGAACTQININNNIDTHKNITDTRYNHEKKRKWLLQDQRIELEDLKKQHELQLAELDDNLKQELDTILKESLDTESESGYNHGN